ncbi:related to PET112 - putative glutamyl-tRNA(Gln)amidotransferase subunit B, mitochondrial precursor [Melanopsichium pennsylvanicum]|uniref:Glutamyl-tRNA(Gln) amidotransferase subunit B, mitochondrial n=2 Tax=Melanopsichium pennsylvanicum TaxID=63383 RepID=A0AAJ4XR03_9BASI|nr:related to PET112-putative glutamyl-tRNA(Gln)amidotransferase subunit B, mitochondrial precursor [Melanopsichium pennsylvanicum 4]SNX87624.1 related to PET112 - putative glutamyl-tRNA(Gln)amidotransferase subunit B, mitochondrial precursor [Melanopsichium pennsylvanicum]
MVASRCTAISSACRRCLCSASSSSRASTSILAAPSALRARDVHSLTSSSSSARRFAPLLTAVRPDRRLKSQGTPGASFLGTSSVVLAKKKKGKAKTSSTTSDEALPSSRYPPLPPGWHAVIGVECHIQLKSTHKLFSPLSPLPTPSTPPNTLVSAFDAAHPGTFPVLNRSSLRLAVLTALALNCTVHSESRFDRKHYFYSDLPAGYQITQKYAPLANDGQVKLSFDEGYLPSKEDEVVVKVEQLQLEQDTAKSSYFDTGVTSRFDESSEATLGESQDERVGRSFVDLNRAGSGLMEIVSGPQMRSPEQAGAYVRKLQELVRRVGASDGNMQEGSLRCDVNVSVNRIGEEFGTRCEVKNLNSVRFMMNAISYESHRQVRLLQEGGQVEQETRGYNESTGKTFRLRGKEGAPDYRYMPDPNLPPVLLSQQQVEKLREEMPELPDARRARLTGQYGLSARDVNVLMRVGSEDDREGRTQASAQVESSDGGCDGKNSDAVAYFETVANGRNPQTALNWIIHELMKGLNARNLPFRHHFLPPHYLGQLIDLVESSQVTGTTAKSVISDLLSSTLPSQNSKSTISLAKLEETAKTSDKPVSELLRKEGILALSTGQDLLPLVKAAMARLEDEVAQVRKGNVKVAMRIVGQVMKDANGRADAKLVHRTILELLEQAPTS